MNETGGFNENFEFHISSSEDEDKPVNPTLVYYNKNADAYSESVAHADMSASYQMFTSFLPAGARILDFGCGTGRDAKYFMDQGFVVTAVDGSEEMCRKTESFTGLDVRRMHFLELNDREIYAGIWASASLLHLPKKDLPTMLAKLRKALVKDGVLYVSFREGTFEGVREDGRYFTDLTEGELFRLVNTIGGLKVIKVRHDVEQREKEEIHWLCAVIRKW